DQLRVLCRYTKNVIACFDGDAAGRKASMRALEIFLQAGLLGRGIFIPSGFDPDTFVRERGAAAFAESIEKSELLVDYFIRDQAEKVGGPNGPLQKRAEAATQIAEKLRLIGDEIQFNLIVRKAEGLLGIGEEVLRKEARGAGRAATPLRFARDSRANANAPTAASAAVGGDAGAKAEIGLIALALLHPELRNEIAQAGAEANFEEIRLGSVLGELCRTDEPYTALEQWIADRLTADEQGRVSEFAVGPLTDDIADDIQKERSESDRSRALVNDFVVALERRRRARELGRLRASAGDPAGAQAVIAHRRGA
ncbi:MAG TPA: toprim domain-containing protein, partial [Candidatus Binatus sp.]|nr:toprim domain-containing protein [Candidatus Binatus sp.]